MTDKTLAAFAAARRTGSFSSAAWELSASQQAVSYTIKKLEEELGFPLFVRRASRVELTAGGEQLYAWYSVLDRGAEELSRRFPGAVPEGSVSDHQVRCFLAAARSGSLARAAEGLYYTPQNLASILTALEKALGVTLFRRDRDALALTEAGRAWWNFFEEAAASLRSVTGYARAEYQDRKRAAVAGVSEWLSTEGPLGRALADFGAAETVILPNQTLLEALEDGRVDMALWSDGHAPVNRGLELTPLAAEEMCLYIPEDGAPCPLLICPGWPRSFLENRAISTQETSFPGFVPTATRLVDTLDELISLLEAGGFAAVGDARFGRFRAIPGLRAIPLGMDTRIVACRRTNASDDCAARLLAHLRSAFVGATKD